MNIKQYLIMIFIIVPCLLIDSIEIKFNVINDSIREKYRLSFMKNSKLLLFNNKYFLIYDYKENKVLEKVKADKDLFAHFFDLQNDMLLARKMENFPVAAIYDIKTGKGDDLIRYFGEEKSYPYYENCPLYWDYYGNNDLIIYQHNYTNPGNIDRKQDYGIYRINIKTGEKKIIISNAGIIDYNHGLLLYFVEVNSENKFYLYDQKNNKTKILNTDLLKTDNNLIINLKIYKNNYFITKNMYGELFLFDGNASKLYKINKWKENTSLSNIKYDFDSDLIGVNYGTGTNIKNMKEGVILFKLEIKE